MPLDTREISVAGDNWQKTMPALTDLSRVRAILDRDRAWAAYALGDLSPHLVGQCSWYAPLGGSAALVLLYRGFSPPIVFAIGAAGDVAPLLRELDAPGISLHVQPHVLTPLESVYRPTAIRRMWRMVVEPSSFRPVSSAGVVSLDASDLGAVNALYERGRLNGEGPTFFHASMLEQGMFRAIREGGDLIAVAGTHLHSAELGVCTIGNIYTRPDRRRRGLAARATSAVVSDAIAQRIGTIVLNVGQENAGARRVYEQLGFRCYCEFVEGEAVALRTNRARHRAVADQVPAPKPGHGS
jgi:GNAT superfamily N-acetyltransferase